MRSPTFLRVPGGAAVGGGDARQAVGPVEGAVGAEGGAGGGGGRADRGGGGGGAVALVRLQQERWGGNDSLGWYCDLTRVCSNSKTWREWSLLGEGRAHTSSRLRYLER